MKIQDAPKYQRPREKLSRYGVIKLKDEELLAVVLGSGMKGMNVVQLARRILKRLEKEPPTLKALLDIKGLGEIQAGKVLAALEFGRRYYAPKEQYIRSSEDVFQACADIRTSKKEHFIVFYLNARGGLLARETISIGTLTQSIVHPREVFEPALRYGAASILVAHNHPSGDCTPSDDDELVTAQLTEVGELLGIELVGHVIVSKDSYTNV